MLKKIVFSSLLILIASPVSADPPFSVKGLKPGKMVLTGHYDNVRTPATYTVSVEKCDEKPCFRLVWNTRVRKVNMLLRPDGSPIRTRYFKPKEETVVDILYGANGAIYKYKKKGETVTTKISQDGLVETLALDILLMAFPFDEKERQVVFYGIDTDSDDGDVYKFYAEIDGVETVKMRGKAIKAYKVEVALKGIEGLFGPTFYFWYSYSAPHQYLMYEGPDEKFVCKKGNLSL